MKKQRISIFISGMIMIFLCCACGAQDGKPMENAQAPKEQVSQSVQTQQDNRESEEIVYGPDSYDSQDTAVLLSKDTTQNTVTLYNRRVGRQYTLQVVGTSTLCDKYGEPLSLAQFQPGDIVELTFLKDLKRLNSMEISTESWSNTSVSRYELDWERKVLTIGEDVYNLSEDTILLSEGEIIEVMDLHPVDRLSFKGMGNDVLSISVEKGHGYLRLENDVNFIGGFIEVGQTMIRTIEEDMLLTVPEGTYEVLISHNGGGGTKKVTIGRQQEVTLDIGDLEVVQVQYGTVIFTTSPEDVVLYIDGSKVDADAPVKLEYGIHQIIAIADGYDTMTSYIKVGQESAGIELVLDEEGEENQKDKDDTEYYKVHIDAPENVEVYLDGNYVGIAPVSFKKEAGTHTITLRKSGYETRSYTVAIDDEEKDISYSFADLVESSLMVSPQTDLEDVVSDTLGDLLHDE